MRKPLVSVIMPVYNEEIFLREAIESILNQTFKDFEFIILNDGSTDRSEKIILSYKDPRILYIKNEKNLGIVDTLNKGISVASGKYIARMDADDISFTERLEKQVRFMETHPDIGISGTWIKTIGERNGEIWKYPLKDKTIRSELLFTVPLAHPSVIIRRDVINKYRLKYDSNYKYAEDYKLWTEASKYTKLANIGKVLLAYRLHSNQIRTSFSKEQMVTDITIKKELIKELDITANKEEIDLHYSISKWRSEANTTFINQAGLWLSKLKTANYKKQIYPEPAFSETLNKRWYFICSQASLLGLWIFKTYWNFKLIDPHLSHAKETIKLALRCIFYKRNTPYKSS